MNGRILIKTSINIRSPFLFPAVDAATAGLDASPLRLTDGTPLLPGDHVRGHMRHVTNGEPWVADLFGSASEYEDNNRPRRSKLIVQDFVATKFKTGGGEQTKDFLSARALSHRVAIDDKTGAAKDGMLKVMELAAAPETIVTFEGNIILRPGSGATTSDIEALLKRISAMGAMKSSGYGEVVDIHCETVTLAHTPSSNSGDIVTLDLTISGPFIVDAARDAFNFYRGSTVIPGSALKGAVAEHLMDFGAVAKDDMSLSKIRFSHAWPLVDAKLGNRSIPEHRTISPMTKELMDFKEIGLAETADGTPAFPTDWKDSKKPREELGRPYVEPTRQSRVRTAISDRGTAQDSMLFVETAIVPDKTKWQVTLTRNDADQDVFDAVVGALTNGIYGLGKTGAMVTGREAQPCNAGPAAEPAAGRCLIQLETPAILTEAEPATDDTVTNPEKRQSELDRFRAFFQKCLPNSTLNAVYGGDEIAGRYYGFRFGKQDDYTPFLVTRAGTVFDLDVAADDVVELEKYISSGLPPVCNGELVDDATADWKELPLVPANGYGEISVVATEGKA